MALYQICIKVAGVENVIIETDDYKAASEATAKDCSSYIKYTEAGIADFVVKRERGEV